MGARVKTISSYAMLLEKDSVYFEVIRTGASNQYFQIRPQNEKYGGFQRGTSRLTNVFSLPFGIDLRS